jgi:glycine/D-amino acid oxidase-like deaminating enzyme
MISYWQKTAWVECDYAVVGAGIIGLSAALSLKEREPRARVVVVERGLFPQGASVRNAGFACFGSLTEILHDCALNGKEQTARLVAMRYEGLQRLRARLGDDACGFEHCGGGELLFERNLGALERLEEINDLLAPIFGRSPFYRDDRALHDFGFEPRHVKALVRTDFEGQIHSGLAVRGLAELAEERGVRLLWGVELAAAESGPTGAELTLKTALEHSTLRAAEGAALCANAAIADFAPELGITPARGQILLTKPLPLVRFRGAFHFNEGFYYFRHLAAKDGMRILFGGGRNLDAETERTNENALNPLIQNELERLLRELIAPRETEQIAIETRWSGIMGFSPDKTPIIRRISDKVVVGFGCNGMGVALGSLIGEQTAAALLGGKAE